MDALLRFTEGRNMKRIDDNEKVQHRADSISWTSAVIHYTEICKHIPQHNTAIFNSNCAVHVKPSGKCLGNGDKQKRSCNQRPNLLYQLAPLLMSTKRVIWKVILATAIASILVFTFQVF